MKIFVYIMIFNVFINTGEKKVVSLRRQENELHTNFNKIMN